MSAKGKGKRQVTCYSDWMSQLPPTLHNIPLFNLSIPGSHDSMSYDLDVNSSIVEPENLRKFSKICCVRKLMLRWAATQEDSITDQLNAGVRYFDLRIARKPNDTNHNRLYFYHGLYTKTDVESALRVINDWAEKHRKEIIILSFSHFKGFHTKSDELHGHLINLIMTSFKTKVAPRGVIPSLKSCWDQGTNVIVSYDDSKYHPYMWNKISYFYGDSMDPAKVQSELSHVLEKTRPSDYFFVCGLNLTLPENGTILLYLLRLCDNFANVVRRSLPRLLEWVKQQGSRKPNIIASDLACREDFVSTVIQLNMSMNK